ncbi:hypothetical protein ACQ4M3_20555 [Leptolyngbya sp. AN03gr2]|uniref:hypothetical protein n=1 Tax=Leptolyngbya sp. AN03gr2 TaxID=3423364 RepID=UPI003D3139EF
MKRSDRFPFWAYLNQPLFTQETVLTPRKFKRHHQNQYLSRCLNLQYILPKNESLRPKD